MKVFKEIDEKIQNFITGPLYEPSTLKKEKKFKLLDIKFSHFYDNPILFFESYKQKNLLNISSVNLFLRTLIEKKLYKESELVFKKLKVSKIFKFLLKFFIRIMIFILIFIFIQP